MKKFIPDFLKRFSRYLVVNHPGIWSLHLHVIVPIWLILLVLSIAAGTSLPVPSDEGKLHTFFYKIEGYFYIMTFVLSPVVIYWGYILVRTRNKLSFSSGLSNLYGAFFYLLVLNLFLGIAYVFAWILEYRGLAVPAIRFDNSARDYHHLGVFLAIETFVMIIAGLFIILRQLPFVRVFANLGIAIVATFVIFWMLISFRVRSDFVLLFSTHAVGVLGLAGLMTVIWAKRVRFVHYSFLMMSVVFLVLAVVLDSIYYYEEIKKLRYADYIHDVVGFVFIMFIFISMFIQFFVNKMHALPKS